MIMIRILIFLTMFLFLINTEANVIHTVYFQPADQPAPTKDDIRDTKGIMLKAQSYFLREMKRHGLAPKTFRLERDGAGMMVIHIVKGKHDLKAYSDVTSLTRNYLLKYQTVSDEKIKSVLSFLLAHVKSMA